MDLSGSLLPYGDVFPDVAASAWVAPGAFVIGAVELGDESSVWYGAVLRGDTEPVRVGARTNVQDGCVLHADPGFPATVGEGCVVGHNAVVHGCGVGDGCLIGMGATILNGAKIGAGSIVAAGAVVPENREFPPRSLIVGIPAKRVGEVTEDQAKEIDRGARGYVERADSHRSSLGKWEVGGRGPLLTTSYLLLTPNGDPRGDSPSPGSASAESRSP